MAWQTWDNRNSVLYEGKVMNPDRFVDCSASFLFLNDFIHGLLGDPRGISVGKSCSKYLSQ